MKARIMASFFIWLAAVVSVAGIAWLAIGTAGRQVTADPISAPLPAELPPVPEATRTTRPAVSPTTVPSTSAGEVPGATQSSRPVTSRPTSPVTSPASRPSRAGGSSRPQVVPVTSTYSVRAGRLRVRCEGRVITLDGGFAQPAPGFAVSVQSPGPDRVQVSFDSDRTPPLTVIAVCAEGRPRFREESPQGRPTPSGTGGVQWHQGFTSQSLPTPTASLPPVCPFPTGSAPVPTVTVTPQIQSSSVDDVPLVCPSAEPSAPVASVPATATATAPATAASVPANPAASEPWRRNWSEREWAQRARR